MSMTRLADADFDTAWAHHAWSDFDAMPGKHRVLVILPVHGFADHGLGLPLDAEEAAGAAILRRAVAKARAVLPLLVLPPLRFGLAPYPHTHFGLNPDETHDLVREIAAGVKDAGFSRLVFFCTSPWNKELVDAAATDLRVEAGLQTFVINLAGLGPDFHPASERRADAQAIAAHVLGVAPDPAGARPADVRDPAFRPGNFRQPAPLPPPVLAPDPVALIDSTAGRLARLLAEIDAHPPAGAAPLSTIKSRQPARLPRLPDAEPVSAAGDVFAAPYRALYLPALTQAGLDALPDKSRALVIIPTGAVEQHGPHLPVGVDAILGQAWLDHALPKLSTAAAPRVLVAPPVTYGKSNEHSGFPGTVGVSARTLRRLLLALAGHLRGLGFRHLALLNTHGGNSPVLVYALREIQTALGLRAGMLALPRPAALSAQEAANGFHAGEWETALMLACAGRLVRPGRAVREYPASVDDPGELRPGGAPAVFAWRTRDISVSGVMGDATAATLKKGARWLDETSAALARRIEELLP